MKKVSVIIPVYNSEKTLDRCINSVLHQTFQDYELIIVNDGSIDNSKKIVESYAELYPEKIGIITVPNSGAGGARNKGLDIAEGEYILFLDSDDYIEVDTLETLYNGCEKNNAGIARCAINMRFWGINLGDVNVLGKPVPSGTIIIPNEDKEYVFRELPSPCNKMVKRELYENLRFPERIKWEDIALTKALLARADRILHLNDSKYKYCTSLRSTTVSDFIKPTPRVVEVFDSNDALEANFRRIGLYSPYEELIKSRIVFEALLRVENVCMWPIFPREKRRILINLLVNMIELRYGEWRNNPAHLEYKQQDGLYKYIMDQIEQKFLSEFSRFETSETVMREKVKSLF